MEDKVKAKIQKLVPNLDHYCCKFQSLKREDWCDHCLNTQTVLTLAVVLRAIEEVTTLYNIRADSKYDYRKHFKQGDNLVSDVDVGNGNDAEYGSIDFAKLIRLWNLEHDNYDWHFKNRPETVEFIRSLLGV